MQCKQDICAHKIGNWRQSKECSSPFGRTSTLKTRVAWFLAELCKKVSCLFLCWKRCAKRQAKPACWTELSVGGVLAPRRSIGHWCFFINLNGKVYLHLCNSITCGCFAISIGVGCLGLSLNPYMTKFYIDVVWVILFHCVYIERFFCQMVFPFKTQCKLQTLNGNYLSPPPTNMCAKCHVLVSIINKGCMSLGSIANNSLGTLGLCLPNTIIAIF